MKITLKYLIALACFSAFSCEDFLVRAPYDYLAVENFYETERDIELATLGCYNALVDIKNSREIYANENRSDNATYKFIEGTSVYPNEFLPSILTIEPSNTYNEDYWDNSYNLISRVNLILEHIDVVKDEMKKKNITGEIKFLRAFVYFNLVRYYGGVPLITTPITSGSEARQIRRESAETNYDFIVNELKEITLLFTEDFDLISDYGKANEWAVKALLGKVLIARNENAEAQAILQDVYQNSGYTLVNHYGDLFCEELETSAAPKEVLFPIRFEGGGLGLGANYPTLAAYVTISKFGSNVTYYSNSLLDAFIAYTDTITDDRFRITCGDVPDDQVAGQPILRRYPPKSVGLVKHGEDQYETVVLPIQYDSGLDWPEIRFSDVILMLAELKGFNDEGLALLNEVRMRSNAPVYTENDINEKFSGDFREAVLQERRLELAFEGHRFFDLMRMGDEYASETLFNFYKSEPAYSSVYPAVYNMVSQLLSTGKIESWRFLLPIPMKEILRSENLVQNPGYSQ